MKFTEFASYIRLKTATDATTFTSANILILANIHKDKMAMSILGADENFFGTTHTSNLVADQREYLLDATSAGRFKFIEAKLDGTNWHRLFETDFNLESLTSDETGIQTAFTGRDPAFTIWNKSLYILSSFAITAVANGLKIWDFIWPADFTDLTLTTDMAVNPTATTHGWPRQFQELLARKVIIDYKESRDKPMNVTQTDQAWERDMNTALDSIMHPNGDRSVLATTPEDSGEDY